MKLYYFETPNPRKPCAVAKHLGSPVEFVKVDLTKGEQKDRHLNRRDIFKQNRSAALAEWRELMA